MGTYQGRVTVDMVRELCREESDGRGAGAHLDITTDGGYTVVRSPTLSPIALSAHRISQMAYNASIEARGRCEADRILTAVTIRFPRLYGITTPRVTDDMITELVGSVGHLVTLSVTRGGYRIVRGVEHTLSVAPSTAATMVGRFGASDVAGMFPVLGRC